MRYNFKITKGVYVLKTKAETITGRSYFDCLVKMAKTPIPIGLARMDMKGRFNWVEDKLKERGI
tara:strand:+ start:97 stop:288 length:192 start_codon:yes stop_codon:yes gene_type:complete